MKIGTLETILLAVKTKYYIWVCSCFSRWNLLF